MEVELLAIDLGRHCGILLIILTMTMDVGQLLITQTDSHEGGSALWNLPEGESWVTKALKGFFGRECPFNCITPS